MKKLKITLLGLLLGLSALWLLAEFAALPVTAGLFPWRTLLVQYSGVLGMGVMSAAMLLAVRPAWIERRLHGLDKMYRLHKWLGISGLVISILHWLISQVPKWLVGAGLLERPARGPRPVQTDPILALLQSQRGLAEDLGEKAFYLAVALIALALIKRFPYRHFFRTHRWLALAYLVLVWHALILTNFSYWTQPVGIVQGLLLAGGTVAAIISLTRRIGVRRKAVGDTVTVEGPYGRFQFDGEARRQIWIGGGIGITPFVARLKQLAQQSDGRQIDLFHSTADVDETALQRLRQDAEAAGVRLHLLVSGRDGLLTGERLRALVPQWQDAEVWFCGPAGFGDAIRTDLCGHGLPPARFHQELFELR